MPIMYKKNIVYTVLCTLHYCTVYIAWPKSYIGHYFHSCDGGGSGVGVGGEGGVMGVAIQCTVYSTVYSTVYTVQCTVHSTGYTIFFLYIICM